MVKKAFTGIEIYKTTDSNVEDVEEKEKKEGYVLQNGDITEITYLDNLFNASFEYDYEDISGNGTAVLTNVKDGKVYKGKKIAIKKGWSPSKWDDLVEVFLGFVINQIYDEEGVVLTQGAMTKLLEKKVEFDFKDTKRSEILKEIITTAGLKPKINVKGLKDDKIDFTNVSSSDSGDTTGAYSEDVGELASKVCKGKKTDRDKAQAIHSWIQQNVQYPSPNYYDHHKCPSEVIKSGYSNCCDRARLGHEMGNSQGLTSRGVHGHSHVWLQYKLDGDWVNSDPGQTRPKLGAVYGGSSYDSVWSFPSCK